MLDLRRNEILHASSLPKEYTVLPLLSNAVTSGSMGVTATPGRLGAQAALLALPRSASAAGWDRFIPRIRRRLRAPLELGAALLTSEPAVPVGLQPAVLSSSTPSRARQEHA